MRSYIAGFDYTRNWQIRAVKDFGPAVSLGLSIENPASEVYASAGAIANGGSLNGLIVNWANAGNSFLGSGAFANNFNTETAPDIIGKAAFDPGWGHYEVFGLARFFTDSVFTCSPALVPASGVCPLTTANVGSASSHVTVGEGVGGSVLLPVVPKYLDLQGSVLYGNGIGRYGASQLSDVVVGSDGTLSTITALHAMVGAVGHPWAGLDIYGYAGMEKADSKVFNSAAGLTGFGVPTLSNAGCGIVTGASFTGGTSNCAAVNKEVDMATIGFWQISTRVSTAEWRRDCSTNLSVASRSTVCLVPSRRATTSSCRRYATIPSRSNSVIRMRNRPARAGRFAAPLLRRGPRLGSPTLCPQD